MSELYSAKFEDLYTSCEVDFYCLIVFLIAVFSLAF